ncbi:MAG TPA: site-specific integrase [Candidatus Pacearchaeota archaeon]|nr:site-specific integrase [Candidatus Pacearchaeota archaeon]
MMESQTLLYDATHKLPEEIWVREDIELMLKAISDSKDYLHNIWGLWMRARDRLILKIMFEHALRPKETCCLKFEDINLKAKTIRIKGENNKVRKDRLLPINENIALLFIEYIKFPRWLWKGSPYLFPSFSNQFLSPGRWKHIFREKVLKPSGLWKKPEIPSKCKTRSYTLRHSKATELINKTNDIYLVANILGHGDIRSTKAYLHLNKNYMEYMRKSLNK